MKTFQTIFFDLDHTLWDFERNSAEALAELYTEHKIEERHGIAPDTFIEHYRKVNFECWEAYRLGSLSKKDLRIERFRIAFNAFGIEDPEIHNAFSDGYVAISPEKTHLFPNAKEVLDYLHEKYPMYIITNGFEEIQHKKLRNCGIESYFKKVITSEMAGARKPNPEIYKYALALSASTPSQCIMIGDEPSVDLLGAREMGIAQVHFHPESETGDEKSDYRIRDLIELKNFL